MTTFPFYPPDRAAQYERAAAEYAFVQTEATPWTPLRRELRRCKAVIVTTSGVRLKTQHMFARNAADFREISVYSPADEMAFDFTNYDPAEAEQDLNVLVPVDRLKDLVDRESLGGLNETFLSFFGPCTDIQALRASAAGAGERLRGYGCDVAFVLPANLVCNQTAGLIARELEREGVSTVCAVTVREIAQQVRVPRSVFIHFPFGRTLGRAGDVATQESIIADMARALRTLERPGKILELPYRWRGPIRD
jgi:D-proline reductase (dithiol) PrdB